jgi:hypothetical protein
VAERHGDGNRPSYTLTAAGRELRPIVEALGQWGIRWIPTLGEEDLDPHLLMCDIHRNVDLDAVPAGRTVLRVTLRDVAGPARDWWLVITEHGVDLFDTDPGHPVTTAVETDLRILTEVWRVDRSWSTAVRSDGIELTGPAPARRAVPHWLTLSAFAAVPRPA